MVILLFNWPWFSVGPKSSETYRSWSEFMLYCH